MGNGIKRVEQFCERAALGVGWALFVLLALCSQFLTAYLGVQSWSNEAIVFVRDGAAGNLIWTALMLFILAAFCRGASRLSGMKLGAGLLGIWCALALLLTLGANVVQMYDFAYVLEGAELFAQGNYKPLTIDYFSVCSYQLGICLPMEMVKRVLPGVNLSLFMQGINVLLSAGTVVVMCALCHVLFGGQAARMTLVLYVLFMPMALQCIFVYSTLPMLLMTSLSVLCFALYLKKRKACLGIGYALCIACAYMLKMNAAVPMLALLICAVLDVMTSRDWKLLGFAAMSVLLAVVLLRAAIMQYELRAGVTLTDDVSMLARLVMGLQEGGAEAGWYNRYIERFFPFEVTAQQEYAIASADLAARVNEMKQDPAMTLAFFRDKLLSQWLEPSYGAMWYGNLCEHRGPLGEITKMMFADGGEIRVMLEHYMAIFQKAMYALFAVGFAVVIKRKKAAGAVLVLVVSVIGGCLYHMIFEAKAQYLYVYVMLLMPLAALGLTRICAVIWRRKA